MNAYFITTNDFAAFVNTLAQGQKVIGPRAKTAPKTKKTKFVFGEIKNMDDLRLDYDVTVLPPKKVFMPTCQKLVSFDGGQFKGEVDSQGVVLFGVHFYDIKGLDMTDKLFNENNRDVNYMAKREASTIVGSNIQTIHSRAFWGSVGKELKPQGHDAFLTKIKSGYVLECRTPKGEALVKHGNFTKATNDHMGEADQVNQQVLNSCPEKLSHSSHAIAEKVRKSFGNQELWANLAEDCFSCGSCNTTCPTCYCFDVQDKWNLNQISGMRNRYWDACLTDEFAKVSLGGGAEENFRETRGERFRHRIMRKTAYLNEKLNSPACVGCGRCSAACTADIADPVNVINKIMEV